jgi:adenylate kinase
MAGNRRSRTRVAVPALSAMGLCAAAGRGFVAPSVGMELVATGRVAAGTAPSSSAPEATFAAASTAAPIAALGALAVCATGLSMTSVRRTKQQRRTAVCARGGADGPLVVIAGPPAAGKGTQCEKIKEKYGYVHISTGDILRENVKAGTELGIKAKGYMDSGALVPSELIVDLVKDRLTKDDVKKQGCLLDGFPRAPDQAQAMVDAGLKVERMLLIEVPDETLVERGCGRRLDPETGDIYHMKFKPPPADIMDRLVHRSDDQEEAIRNRLKGYHSQIDAIVPFFEDALVKIDGTSSPDEVFGLVSAGLDSL